MEILLETFKILESEKIKNINCDDVVVEEIEEVKENSKKMIETCLQAGGIGLSAPQVGINKKYFVWMNSDSTFEVVINPMYYPEEKKVTNVAEMCLSLPEDNNYIVKRYKKIRATFFVYDEQEKQLIKTFRILKDDSAFVWQHEIDHLFGKTIDDIGILL